MQAFETWCAALAYHNKLDSAAAILQAPIAPSIRKLIDLQITVACSPYRLSLFGVVFIGHPAGSIRDCGRQLGTNALSSHDSRSCAIHIAIHNSVAFGVLPMTYS